MATMKVSTSALDEMAVLATVYAALTMDIGIFASGSQRTFARLAKSDQDID
jgi:hypothetical protein